MELPSTLSGIYLQLLISLGIFILMLITRRITRKLVKQYSGSHSFKSTARASYITKAINTVAAFFFLSLFAIVWEVSFQGLSIYFASFFTIAGVALFAQWSILSNITASVIIFFFFPYKIGSVVKIMDGDNSVEGIIIDITLFCMMIEKEDGKIVSYPNNLAMQKAVINISD